MTNHDVLLVKVEIGYSSGFEEYKTKIVNVNAAFAKANIDFTLNDDAKDEGKSYYPHNSFEGVINSEQMLTLMECGLNVVLKSRYKISGTQRDFINLKEQVEKLIDKIDQIDSGIFLDRQEVFNQKCDVHVPGMALMLINRTMLLEDCCTDRLQSHLTDGWRIIAACPQPDQRRPDYILGRYEPEISDKDTNYADRG